MKKYLILALACLIFSANACKKSAGSEVEPEKGYATGKVVDTKGYPMANVEVVITNQFHGNLPNHVGKTDQNGNYKIKVATVGTYHASASFVKTVDGIERTLELHCDNDEVFSNEGAVRNFQWKLSGQKYENKGYYGASVDISGAIGESVADQENIEFTLTPISKLLDGSDGATIKLKPVNAYGYQLLDIPIAKYSVSAIYKGQTLKLKNRNSNETYQTSATIQFPADWAYNIVALDYKF